MTANREVIVTDSNQLVTLAMDADAPLGQRTWGVISMQLVDEITAKAPTGQIRLWVQQQGFQPRVAAGGFAGLVANPFNVFPNLNNQSYPLNLSVQADGYLPVQLTSQVDQVTQPPGFPAVFVPANLGKVDLHTFPTVIRGRAVRVSAAGVVTPLAGATIEVAGFWLTAPTLLANPPASAPNLLAVTPPLYSNRGAAGGVLRRRNMTIAAGQDKTLLKFAPASSQVLDLSDRVGAAPGGFLTIEPGSAEHMEIMEIASVSGASTAQQPARVTLTHPLAFSHPRDTLIQPVTLTAPGFSKNITRDAYTGDTSVYLNNLTGVVSAVIEVSGGVPLPEYHRFQLYATTSGPDGYYRLPPIHRAGMLFLRAHQSPLTDVEINFAPDYGQPENRVDFVFSQ